MQTEYRRDLQHSYLVVRMEENQEAGYPLQMILKNRIPGLLECDCRRIDEDLLYYYDVTSRISLEERCRTQKVTGEEILQIVEQMVRTITQLEEYLLSPDELCIEPAYIFLDPQMLTGAFCFIPGKKKPIGEGFRELMEYCLPVLDHENQKEAMIVYGLYHYSVQPDFSMEGLQEEIRKHREKEEKEEREEEIRERRISERSLQDGETKREQEWEEQRHHEEALKAFFEEDEEESEQHPVLISAAAAGVVLYFLSGWFFWKNYPGVLMYWGGAGILFTVGGIVLWKVRKKEGREEEKDGSFEVGATQLLHVDEPKKQYLLEERSPRTGRQIMLGEQEVQIVGSLEEEVQVCIPSSTVSRFHARLRKQGNRYYLCDLHSKNGTWINGRKLAAEQEEEMRPQDEVRFADRIYCFKER